MRRVVIDRVVHHSGTGHVDILICGHQLPSRKSRDPKSTKQYADHRTCLECGQCPKRVKKGAWWIRCYLRANHSGRCKSNDPLV